MGVTKYVEKCTMNDGEIHSLIGDRNDYGDSHEGGDMLHQKYATYHHDIN